MVTAPNDSIMEDVTTPSQQAKVPDTVSPFGSPFRSRRRSSLKILRSKAEAKAAKELKELREANTSRMAAEAKDAAASRAKAAEECRTKEVAKEKAKAKAKAKAEAKAVLAAEEAALQAEQLKNDLEKQADMAAYWLETHRKKKEQTKPFVFIVKEEAKPAAIPDHPISSNTNRLVGFDPTPPTFVPPVASVGGVLDMEGVFEYPPAHTMTAEELKRVSQPKRKATTPEGALAPKKAQPKPPPNVPNEIPETVLMPPPSAGKPMLSSLQQAANAVEEAEKALESKDYAGQVVVEQEDYVCMEGNPEVWEPTNIETLKDDEKDAISILSMLSLLKSDDEDDKDNKKDDGDEISL